MGSRAGPHPSRRRQGSAWPGGRCRVDRAGGTAFDARKTTTALVDSGVFRFTRNPVYLSMVLLVIGVGLILNSSWSLLLAVPTGSALCLTAIRPEERYLEAKFGETYRAYRSEVPRWFSIRRVLTAF